MSDFSIAYVNNIQCIRIRVTWRQRIENWYEAQTPNIYFFNIKFDLYAFLSILEFSIIFGAYSSYSDLWGDQNKAENSLVNLKPDFNGFSLPLTLFIAYIVISC